MTGQCKLCLKTSATLRDSHFLPKGVYKRLRDNGERNPNPWALSRNKAIQTSKQQTVYLLCEDCEQRLSKNGERWVLGNCLQGDGKFPLASFLSSRFPDISSNNNPTRVYLASKIPEINISALTYFAVSMFWRGSVHPWNEDGSIPVSLGPFQDQLRQYLMKDNLKAFPKYCSLWVVIREGKVDRLTYLPIGERRNDFYFYKFPMPGLAFTLLLGKSIPLKYYKMCFVHGTGNPIYVTTIIDELIEAEAANRLSGINSCRKPA